MNSLILVNSVTVFAHCGLLRHTTLLPQCLMNCYIFTLIFFYRQAKQRHQSVPIVEVKACQPSLISFFWNCGFLTYLPGQTYVRTSIHYPPQTCFGGGYEYALGNLPLPQALRNNHVITHNYPLSQHNLCNKQICKT